MPVIKMTGIISKPNDNKCQFSFCLQFQAMNPGKR